MKITFTNFGDKKRIIFLTTRVSKAEPAITRYDNASATRNWLSRGGKRTGMLANPGRNLVDTSSSSALRGIPPCRAPSPAGGRLALRKNLGFFLSCFSFL
jgi:hypothetical protein